MVSRLQSRKIKQEKCPNDTAYSALKMAIREDGKIYKKFARDKTEKRKDWKLSMNV